ncbi:cell division protein FtsK, partial [Thioclava sp. BHET1]
TIASPLMIIAGLGSWGIPAVALAWGLRLVLHRGEERALNRVIFAPIAIAMASIFASTHVPGSHWGHSFGLGGLFGDTVLGALLGLLPVGIGLGLKLLSVIMGVAFLSMGLFVLGFDLSELKSGLRFLFVSSVLTYDMLVRGAHHGARGAGRAARDGAAGGLRAARTAAANRRRARDEDEIWEDEDFALAEEDEDRAARPMPLAARATTYRAPVIHRPQLDFDEAEEDDEIAMPEAQPMRAPRLSAPAPMPARAAQPSRGSFFSRMPVIGRRLAEPAPTAEAEDAPVEDRIRARIAQAVDARKHPVTPQGQREEPRAWFRNPRHKAAPEPIPEEPVVTKGLRAEPPVTARISAAVASAAGRAASRAAAAQQAAAAAPMPSQAGLRAMGEPTPYVDITDEDDAPEDYAPELTRPQVRPQRAPVTATRDYDMRQMVPEPQAYAEVAEHDEMNGYDYDMGDYVPEGYEDLPEEAYAEELSAVAPSPAPVLRAPQAAPMTKPVVHQTQRRASQPSRQAQSEAQPDLRFEEKAPAYEHPPLNLLTSPSEIKRLDQSVESLEENARMLETVLDDYGVKGEIVSVRPGPVVTMYELEPAPGLKASRVIGLADDIARSMSALSARVSTVPGRSVIGIELPNTQREKVVLREILSARDFGDGQARLPLALGKDIGGDPIVANLAKMPHLLIAGTTGSGKSVAINTMILSLLYKLSPEECRLIMIDPKMLELSVYDGIPHLLSPVVTDPKKAVVALKWVVGEMEERYRKMSKMGVRNIEGFNGRVREALAKGEMFRRTIQTGFDEDTGEPIFETEEFEPKAIPYIVVIVDEMADLMMVAGKEIEACIQRLAQMARASGIHLIMATQRPSVDVITGTIKANFPTRISFQVTSKIDSRTILGEQGAEQLLGM